jgi:two-component system OmpR family response regulator
VQNAPAGPAHGVALDDDAELLKMLSSYLAGHNLRVRAVVSGIELDETREREAVDLLLLDLNLDGEDGMQMAKRLRETTPMPILRLRRKIEPDPAQPSYIRTERGVSLPARRRRQGAALIR